MPTPHSLRATLLAGLLALQAAAVGGVTVTVWAHARRQAHERLRSELSVRATTLAGLLEFEGGEPEFDASERALPEYQDARSGVYAAIYDDVGQPVVRSPSLGRRALDPASAWEDGAFAFRRIDAGPDGFPCESVTYSFTASDEVGAAAAASVASDGTPADPPTKEPARARPSGGRRCRIVVACDVRPRDAALADLAWFLGLLGAGALALTAGGGLLVARRVLSPIRRMTDEAAALTPEDTSRRLRPESVVRELESLARTLNSALDRLGAALDRQRRFTSDASHELRTPLAVLRGNAEVLLRRDRTAQEYREGLERQLRIAERMTAITENLLALARADAGRTELRRVPVALDALVRGVCGEFETLAHEGRVSLECAAPEDVPVEGDPTHLAGLVQNLVSNAVKFTPAGGAVRVSVRREARDAVLEVADSGPGIPPEERSRVFDRFHRVRDGRDPHEGAGLGLAIADWTARVHGGRIEAGESPGGGALFRVVLPLAGEGSVGG